MYRLLARLGLKRPAALYQRFFNAFWKHYHAYSADDWQDLARRCGFRVVECRTYGPKKMCLLDDFLSPFCLVSFICKRLTNRWVLLPGWRRIWSYPFYLWARRFLRGCEKADPGGLVFMVLTRKD